MTKKKQSKLSNIDDIEVIDIFEVFDLLWKKRLIIIFFVIVSLVCGYFYTKDLKNSYAAKLYIDEISTMKEEKEYGLFNSLIDNNKLTNFTSLQFRKINAEYLMESFINEIKSGDVFYDHLLLLDRYNLDNFDSTRDRDFSIDQEIQQIKIEEVLDDATEKSGKAKWRISFKSNDLDGYLNLLEYSLKKTEENIRNQFSDLFFQQTNNYAKLLMFKFEDLTNQIEIERVEFEKDKEVKLKRLTNEIEIAEMLNDGGNFSGQISFSRSLERYHGTNLFEIDSNKSVLYDVITEDFQKGYMVLKKEFEYLKEEKFISKDSQSKIDRIFKDLNIERLREAFNSTPIMSEYIEFIPVLYNIRKIDIQTYSSKRYQILFLFFLISFISVSALILINNAYKKNK